MVQVLLSYKSYIKLGFPVVQMIKNLHEFEQAPGVGDREAWLAPVHGVTKSRTRLTD